MWTYDKCGKKLNILCTVREVIPFDSENGEEI
jgi:hypothetical protein